MLNSTFAIGGLGLAFAGLYSIISKISSFTTLLISSFTALTTAKTVDTVATNSNALATIRLTAAQAADRLAAIAAGTAIASETVAKASNTVATNALTAANGRMVVTNALATGGITILLGALATWAVNAGLAKKKQEELNESMDDNIATTLQKVMQMQEESDFMQKMVGYHEQLRQKIERGNLSEEEATKTKKYLIATEEALKEVIGEEGYKRLEAAGFTEAAVKNEITAFNSKMEAERKAVANTIDSQIKQTQATKDNALERIRILKEEANALSGFLKAEETAKNIAVSTYSADAKVKEFLAQKAENSGNDDLAKWFRQRAESSKQMTNEREQMFLAEVENERKRQIEEQQKIISEAEKNISRLNMDKFSLYSGMEGNIVHVGSSGEDDKSDKSNPVTHEVSKYEVELSNLDSKLNETKAAQELLNKTTEPYRENLRQEITLLQQKQGVLSQEADALRLQQTNTKLTTAQLDQNKKKVAELGVEWNKVQKEINSNIDQIQQSKLNKIFDKIAKSTKPFENSLKRLKNEISLLDDSQVAEKQEKIQQLNQTYLNYIDTIKKSIMQLEQESLALTVNSDAYKINQDKIQSLKDILETLVFDQRSKLNSQLQSLADDVIDTYKKVYKKQKDIALDEIEKQIKAEEDRHDKVIKDLDDELDKFEEVISAKNKLLDKESDERDYNEQLSKFQDNRQDILNKINVLSLDDSAEARAKITDLNKELTEKDKDIEDLKYDHTKKLREDNLDSQLNAYKKDIAAKKDAEDTKYEIEKDRLDKVKDDTDKFYENLINDEAKFTEIRKQILSGHLETVKSDFATFATFLNANMSNIGNAITNGLINKLKSSLIELQNVQNEVQKLSSISGTSIITPSNSSGNKPSRPIAGDSSWSASEKIAYYSSKTSDAIDDAKAEIKWAGSKYWDYIEQGNASGALSANQWANQIRVAIGESLQTTNLTEIQSIINAVKAGTFKIPVHHEGGIVGNEPPSKIMELTNKLFGVNSSEVLSKLKKGELVINEKQSSSFISNIQNILNSTKIPQIAMAGGGGSNVYNMNIDKVTGDEKGANLVFEKIVNGIRKLGGKI